jgi:hypothetical protein
MKPSFSNYGGKTTEMVSGGGGGGIWDILGAFGVNAASGGYGQPQAGNGDYESLGNAEDESGFDTGNVGDWARAGTDVARIFGGDMTAIADLVSMFV